jgi:glycosyltransferase involved in cell wall biosynthesis
MGAVLQKKKILHLIESITVGGAEKLVCNTINELPEYEHLIVTVFPTNNLSLLPSGVEHVCLCAKTKADIFFKGGAYKQIIKRYKPDAVHAHLYFSTILAKCFTPGTIPLIFTQHFEFSKNTDKWYYAFIDKFFSSRKQVCIAVSESVKRDYIRSTGFNGEVHVVNNYVANDFFESYKNNSYNTNHELKMVAIGNIKPIKNQRYLINAFRNLKDLPVSCDVYGEGHDKEILAAEADKEKIKVYFKGLIEDTSKVLPFYDLYIMPSLTEGFPLALFEAMACGLPVLVSDIPVFHELLDPEGNFISLADPSQVRGFVEKYLQNTEAQKKDGQIMHNMAVQKASKDVYLSRLRLIYSKAF